MQAHGDQAVADVAVHITLSDNPRFHLISATLSHYNGHVVPDSTTLAVTRLPKHVTRITAGCILEQRIQRLQSHTTFLSPWLRSTGPHT